ncbi:hypothetical protein GCM10020331_003690 [Ectobacillus funiculus]
MIDRKNGAKEALEDIGIEVVTEQIGYNHFWESKTSNGEYPTDLSKYQRCSCD